MPTSTPVQTATPTPKPAIGGSWTGAVGSSGDDTYSVKSWGSNYNWPVWRIAGGGSYDAGLRFAGVNIRRGTLIKSAKLSVNNNLWTWQGTSATIYGEATGSATGFGVGSLFVGQRPKTSASVGWRQAGTWVNGTWYDSPDLTAVVQEIVNRSDWTAGNALALLLKGGPEVGYRSITAYDADSNGAARLVINY